MLTASAQQGLDWSAAYRFFEHERFDLERLFAPALQSVLRRLEDEEPLVALMDDTLIRKRGRKIHGTAWKRDPLGPPFCNNFVWAQRFVQLSAALPESPGPSRARGIPVDWWHAPLPLKPKKKAPAGQWQQYREQQALSKVSAVGVNRIRALRGQIDRQGQEKRKLIVAVDGTFTNKTVFRALPENTVAVGRLRKDARLFAVPADEERPRRGRKRFYGDPLPGPEQLRQDASMPWTEVEAWAAGKLQRFEIKTLAPVRWMGSGKINVRLVVIRPLAYRRRQRGQAPVSKARLPGVLGSRASRSRRFCRPSCGAGKSRSTSGMKRPSRGWAKRRCEPRPPCRRCRPSWWPPMPIF